MEKAKQQASGTGANAVTSLTPGGPLQRARKLNEGSAVAFHPARMGRSSSVEAVPQYRSESKAGETIRSTTRSVSPLAPSED